MKFVEQCLDCYEDFKNLYEEYLLNTDLRFCVSKFSTIKELFELFFVRRKFHMFPIVLVLILMIGITALASSGLITLIYPI